MLASTGKAPLLGTDQMQLMYCILMEALLLESSRPQGDMHWLLGQLAA